jgi:tRNA modification GTPase
LSVNETAPSFGAVFIGKEEEMETIASIATAVGMGGIAIVRISGPEARDILARIFAPKNTKRAMRSHQLVYGWVMEGEERIDECMAVYMKGPRTYTTEDVAEIQCHGGRVLAERVLAAALRQGARLAEPGEFTKRAFLGGRIDLAQAEGVMDLIGAKTERAARQGMQQMDGYLSRRIHELQDQLLDTVAYLEAYLDYPDEDIEALTQDKAAGSVRAVQEELGRAVRNARAGRMLSAGARIVLAGSPNTGKSSLLNCLLREQRAIVTAVPGTTRDVLREEMDLYGLPVTLADTAGLRASQDEAERIGIGRAREELERADVTLMVLDGARELDEEERALLSREETPLVAALNKADLAQALTPERVRALAPGAVVVRTCAKTGEGVEALRRALYEAALRGASPEEAYLTRERHLEAARRALDALERAQEALRGAAMDCAALDLRAAWEALGAITGACATEDVVDRIFEKFCLGK